MLIGGMWSEVLGQIKSDPFFENLKITKAILSFIKLIASSWAKISAIDRTEILENQFGEPENKDFFAELNTLVKWVASIGSFGRDFIEPVNDISILDLSEKKIAGFKVFLYLITGPVYGGKVGSDLSVLLNQEYDIDPQIFGYIASMIENLIKLGMNAMSMISNWYTVLDNEQKEEQWKKRLQKFTTDKRLLVFLTLDFAEDIINNQWHDADQYGVPVLPPSPT